MQSQTVHLPLHFWFNKDPQAALPMVTYTIQELIEMGACVDKECPHEYLHHAHEQAVVDPPPHYASAENFVRVDELVLFGDNA